MPGALAVSCGQGQGGLATELDRQTARVIGNKSRVLEVAAA